MRCPLGLRRRLPEGAFAGELGGFAELFFDAEELIVLGDAVGAAGRAGLDLTRAGRYRQIGDEGILRFAGTMRDHGRVTGGRGHLHRRQRLG